MNIFEKVSKKIEQVRLEPDHVRIRWVWGSVSVSMLFIIAIWIFSMTSLFQGDKSKIPETEATANTPSVTDQLKDLQKQAPSIKDFSDQPIVSGSEGVTDTQNTTTSRRPSSISDNSDISQSNTYSDSSTANSGQ